MSNLIVKFGDVVRQVKDKVDPKKSGLERYIAGEHMETDDLHIRRWGVIGDNYLGPAFHMRFKPGQVLYGSRRTYLRKVAFAEFKGICANTTYVLEPKDSNVLLPELLPFIMKTDSFNEHSVKQSKGSVNPYINFSDIAWYEFPLPPLAEQRRIADLLWAVDETEVSYENVADKLQGVLFSNADNFFKNLQQKSIAIVRLKEVCSQPIVNGIFRRREEFGSGTPLVNVTDIYSAFRIDEQKLERVIANETEQEKYSAKPGDVIYNRSSLVFKGIGHTCLIPKTKEPLVFECHLMRVRPDKAKIVPEYLARLSLSKFGRVYIESVARKTTMTTINQNDLGEMPILLPSIDVQKAISEQLDDIEHKIGEVRQHINVLRVLKVQMLNKILVT
jgi:type I restriction enzyme, S subunit